MEEGRLEMEEVIRRKLGDFLLLSEAVVHRVLTQASEV